jgi:N-acyl-D-aspartate/D-glutamate deacylase
MRCLAPQIRGAISLILRRNEEKCMLDLVIKNGQLVDGTGAPSRIADVAVKDGRIAEVGRVRGRARLTIDADGLLVAPGWLDIHTHYDGQATWDPLLDPSFSSGVTTAIMGNCGVGFAPIADGMQERLSSSWKASRRCPELPYISD